MRSVFSHHFALAFARVRERAEAALLAGEEGRFEVCPLAWVSVSRVHYEEGDPRDGGWPSFEVRCENATTAERSMTGLVHREEGGPPGAFPWSPSVPGNAFPGFLREWEDRGPAELSEVLRGVLGFARSAGMTREGVVDAWDESLVEEVMDA